MINLFDEVKKLNLLEGKFAIFGSGPLAVREIREARDVDIIAKKDLWEQLAEKYPVSGEKKNLIKIENIEVWKDWTNLSDKIYEMIDTSDIIDSLPFVKLRYLIEWKKVMNREKDVCDLKLIEEYLTKKNEHL